MSNIRLKNHTWDAANVYDSTLGKTQAEINADGGVTNSALNGHVVAYGTTDAKMQIYKEINNESVVYGSIPASDFIPCRSDYLYNLFVENSSATSDTKYYVYIYDSNKQIAFNVLKHVNSDTNEINCFTAAEWAQINGFQFKNIPTGYYIRYSLSPYDKVPRLYVWDGVKCGLPLTARSGDFGSDESGQFVSGNSLVSTPSTGRSIMPVPPGVSMLIAKPGYTFVGMRSLMTKNTYRSSINESYVFPSQILSLTGYKCSDNQFKASVNEKFKDVILAKEYNYADGTYNKTVAEFDLSDYVCAVPSFKDTGIQTVEKGFGRSVQIKKVADAINNFTWTCKSTVKVKVKKDDDDDDIDADEYFTLHEGVTYRGIPYRSDWTRATFFGWHITANTFANAANDPNSVLYTFGKEVVDNETRLNSGIYYSLVCSSYGSLISLFPYPGTNFSLVRDPNNQVSITTDPDIGTLISNGVGHCLVPIYKSQNSGSNQSAITAVESAGIFTNLSNYYREFWTSKRRNDNNVAHGAYGTFDLRNYMYDIKYPLKPINVTPYNIDTVTIKNGSARPNKGDGSVYTAYGDVVINIKNADANRLYYQEVTGTFSHGVLDGSLSTVGNASYISFESGSTSVVLQPKITVNSPSPILQNGGIYAVWASNGDAQTTLPDNAEIFEWYDKSGTVRYSVQNGVLYTDDEFWYARGSGYDAKGRIRGQTSGMITIPYEAPSSVGGHSDYSKYADSYSIVYDNTHQVYFFKKGTLGAYQIYGTYTE